MHRAALWQHSSNSNNKIVHNSIEHFLWNQSDFSSDNCTLLSVDCFHKLCFSGTPSENSQARWDFGRSRFDMKWVCPMASFAWGIQVFCSVREMRCYLISRTKHLNTSGITYHGTDSFRVKPITPDHPIYKISTRLTIFWGGTWKTEFVKLIQRQERTSSKKRSDWFHKKCSIELWTILMFELLLCCHTAAQCMERP